MGVNCGRLNISYRRRLKSYRVVFKFYETVPVSTEANAATDRCGCDLQSAPPRVPPRPLPGQAQQKPSIRQINGRFIPDRAGRRTEETTR